MQSLVRIILFLLFTTATVFNMSAQSAEMAKKWTFMVFINGRNDLSTYACQDFNEMEAVGSNDEVNIIAQLGCINGREDVSRYYVEKDADGFNDRIISPIADTVKNSDMGNWEELIDFAQWAIENYPAENYALVVWNHGFGWVDLWGDSNQGAELGIAADFTTMNIISTKQLGSALEIISSFTPKGKLDLYASDACLMQMLGVVLEIKDYAEVIVGAEGIEPEDGYPYDRILNSLVNNPSQTPQELAKVIVDKYAQYYGDKTPITQSAIQTSEIDEFVYLLNSWIKSVQNENMRSCIKSAALYAHGFAKYGNSYDENDSSMAVDLHYFVKTAVRLIGEKKNGKSSDAFKKGKYLKDFINRKLIIANEATSFHKNCAQGIAVYLPKMIYNSSYDEQAVAGETLWDDFIKWILESEYWR